MPRAVIVARRSATSTSSKTELKSASPDFNIELFGINSSNSVIFNPLITSAEIALAAGHKRGRSLAANWRDVHGSPNNRKARQSTQVGLA